MKLVILSDTHCTRPIIPEGDVLIHCGDHTYHGEYRESVAALSWFNNQPHKHKLFIAGNHELGWQNGMNIETICALFPSLTYLKDSGVEIDGVKFWGSPYQPEFMGWAFQKHRGEGAQGLRAHLEKIPDNIDVLITHGPPFGFGDTNALDPRFGDQDLLDRVRVVRPKIHCYGNAHQGTGQWNSEGTIFINAAVLSEEYQLTKEPTVIELEVDADKH